MKMNNKLAIAGALSVLLAAPMAAHAAFNFDPAGTAKTVDQFNTIQLANGNVLAQNGETAISAFANPAGSTVIPFMLYFQANIANFNIGGPSATYNNGTPYFFTLVAGIQEVVTNVQAVAGISTQANVNFDLSAAAKSGASSMINFFNIYASASGGDPITGLGFGNGQLILSAHATSEIPSGFSLSSANPVPLQGPTVPNPNPAYTSTNTLAGSGGSNLTLVVDSVNSGFFTNLLVGGSTTIVASIPSLNTPYTAVAASSCFNGTTLGNCETGGYKPNIGSTNGLPGSGSPDFIAQSTSSASFALVRKVPEPATTALFGLGLAAMGLFGAARRKNKA